MVTFFLDAYSIRSGQRWDYSIIDNLKAADWLIFIYTGRERRSYDYCGFEIGILLLTTLGAGITDAEFQLACRQLIYDVERMEQESSEFGMNSPDLLHQAFGQDNHEIVNAFYSKWFPAREALFAALNGVIADFGKSSRENIRQQVKTFANSMSPYNKRFLEMCIQKYTAHI